MLTRFDQHREFADVWMHVTYGFDLILPQEDNGLKQGLGDPADPVTPHFFNFFFNWLFIITRTYGAQI